jgi:hypothetical protein
MSKYRTTKNIAKSIENHVEEHKEEEMMMNVTYVWKKNHYANLNHVIIRYVKNVLIN